MNPYDNGFTYQFTVVGLECSDIIISTTKSLNTFLNTIPQTSELNSQVHDFHILILRELNTIALTKSNLKKCWSLLCYVRDILSKRNGPSDLWLFHVRKYQWKKCPNIFQMLQLFVDLNYEKKVSPVPLKYTDM